MNLHVGSYEMKTRQEAAARRERLIGKPKIMNWKPQIDFRPKQISQIKPQVRRYPRKEIEEDSHVKLWRWYIKNKHRVDKIVRGAMIEQVHYVEVIKVIEKPVEFVEIETDKRPLNVIVQELIDLYAPRITINEIQSIRREWTISPIRQLSMWKVRDERKDLSFPQIGKWFNRDHSTVVYIVQKIDHLINEIGTYDLERIYTELCRRRPRFVRGG